MYCVRACCVYDAPHFVFFWGVCIRREIEGGHRLVLMMAMMAMIFWGSVI